MGWIAAAGGTLVAGYILYNFLIQYSSRDAKTRPSYIDSPSYSRSGPVLSQSLTSQTEDGEGVASRSILQPEPPVFSIDLPEPQSVPAFKLADDTDVPRPVPNIQPATMAPPPIPIPQMPSTMNRSSSPPRLKPAAFGLMPAPPRPGNGFVRPPPSSASSLRIPPQKAYPNTSMAPTSSIMPPGKQVSRKVILEPGHSPLDWAALTNDPKAQLRGKDAPANLIRVTPEQLRHQNGRKGKDAWTVYHGKVYNLTPYIPFHPGGVGEIMRGAGKDSVKLFMEVHPWVNWDGMLSECLVGIYVSEDELSRGKESDLDEMD